MKSVNEIFSVFILLLGILSDSLCIPWCSGHNCNSHQENYQYGWSKKCTLPPFPSGGKYFLSDKRVVLRPGDVVEPFTLLRYMCYGEYEPSHYASLCLAGNWSRIPVCIKTTQTWCSLPKIERNIGMRIANLDMNKIDLIAPYTILEYTCDHGSGITEHTTVCMKNTTWKPPPACEALVYPLTVLINKKYAYWEPKSIAKNEENLSLICKNMGFVSNKGMKTKNSTQKNDGQTSGIEVQIDEEILESIWYPQAHSPVENETVQNVSENNQAFGEFVASSLQKLKSNTNRLRLINTIKEAILELSELEKVFSTTPFSKDYLDNIDVRVDLVSQ